MEGEKAGEILERRKFAGLERIAVRLKMESSNAIMMSALVIR